jgi:hypothetical protein
MGIQRILRILLVVSLALLTWVQMDLVQAQPPGYSSGSMVFWIEGNREEIFARISPTICNASFAPDDDTWITVDSATLNATNAKAAIVFGHAYAQQDGVGENNGITTYLSKGGTTPAPDTSNQLVHSHVDLAGQTGDEHSVMIIALDANKDFNVRYHFGDVFGDSTDETQLCHWITRIELVGYIE